MLLEHIPLVFMLIGLTAYAALGGADFGAGIWTLLPARRSSALREHARHAMGPVWEANHVWLIFVLVVAWTSYPQFVSSVASTLIIPLCLALVGIVLRGTTYALRAQVEEKVISSRIERVFGLSSLITPFALGVSAGAIAARRVPVGNAAGGLFSSWLNLTAIAIGVLTVMTAWYLASVYLAADAERDGNWTLIEDFRQRALGTGLIAGILAVLALVVLHADQPQLWHGLTHGWGWLPLIASGLAGLGTLGLVVLRHFRAARVAAATAVIAVVADWGVAQSPLLPGLTVHQAAASHATLWAVVITVLGGLVILLPSLALLFRLTLEGQLGPATDASLEHSTGSAVHVPQPVRVATAAGLLVVGAVLTVMFNWWPQGIGVVALLLFLPVAFGPLASPPDER